MIIAIEKILKRLRNKKGSMFVLSYLSIVLLLGVGAAFLMLTINEAKVAERQRLATVAFHIAEAGVERGLYDIRQDFVLDTSNPSWADGDINGYSILNDGNYHTVNYASTSLNNGSYLVEIQVASLEGVWIRSRGSISGASHEILVYARMIDLSPWANAIFAGAGHSGTMVNGKVDIRGSVHILGTGLSDGDYAIDLGGTAQLVGNNYNGVDPALVAKVPALPTVTFGEETVQTLNAKLRVKQGIVGVSGSATVGEPNVTLNSTKETADGVYVTDGFGGTKKAAGVYSDNGTTNAYDLGNAVSFPSLSSPYGGYSNYTLYFQNAGTPALIITDAAKLTQLASIKPTSSFDYTDGTNRIKMDGSGNLTIAGKVYIGGNLGFAKDEDNKDINYTGKGTILTSGNAQIDVNLRTAGNNSFPTNIMGIMTPNRIGFNEANIDVMGVFYAEDRIVVQKQTDMMGTIVSNYFDMGTNVPSIFQVPETVNNLPPGMVGESSKWYIVVAWIKS